MNRKTTPTKGQLAPKSEALLEAEKLLEELIAEDATLGVARKLAQASANGDDAISEDMVQIYRQRLRE